MKRAYGCRESAEINERILRGGAASSFGVPVATRFRKAVTRKRAYQFGAIEIAVGVEVWINSVAPRAVVEWRTIIVAPVHPSKIEYLRQVSDGRIAPVYV